MKTLAALLLLTLSCVADEGDAVVRFSNGDKLTGELLALTGTKLSWQSQILKEPAEFELKHVVDVNLPPGAPSPDTPAAGHEAILEMTNGDSIRGQLLGLGDGGIRLKTWYAGELVLRRVNVKSVKISRTADFHYRGPNSMEEWTGDEVGNGWTFRGGALHADSAGGIAREVDFPEECVIAFDASWRGSFRPKIIFFSDDITTSSPSGGYEMVFQGNAVHVKKAGSNNWLGHSTNAGILRENEKAHIEIKASLRTGKIALFVDGKIIDMWQDDAVDKKALGKGFHLVSQDNSELHISNIEITGWDGYLEQMPDRRRIQIQGQFQGGFRGGFDFDDASGEVEAEEEKIPEGRMVLRNGDSIEGEVLGIKGEDITLKTKFSEVTFPVSRLKNIVLPPVVPPATMETPKLYSGDVRGVLANGSSLVFRLDGVEGGELIGFSQNFGAARFRMDAFKRIQFNIHLPDIKEIQLRDDW
jgi:hypothetical protein